MNKGSEKTVKYDSKRAHIVLIITFGLYLAVGAAAGKIIGRNHPVPVIIMEQLALIIPAFIWFGLGGKKWDKMVAFRAPENYNIRMAVGVMICVYPLVALINFFTMLFVKNAVENVMPAFLEKGFWVSMLVMAVMPAFDEEFLCRGMLYQSYRKKSVTGGAFLSALLFGLLHLNLNQMPYALFLGFIFALMVEATGTIVTSMLMHFLLNGFNVILNYYLYNTEMYTSDTGADLDLAGLLSDPSLFKEVLIAVIVIIAVFLPLTIVTVYRTFRLNENASWKEKEESDEVLWDDSGGLADNPLIILIVFLIILNRMYTVFL